MKVNCEVIQDLLPLYEDGVCSQASRALVEEHLKTCQACQALRQSAQTVPEELPLPEQDVKAVKGFRKIRRRWLFSLIVVLLIFPLLAMTGSQIVGEGVCFTNLDDIALSRRFVHALQHHDFEKAASLYNYQHQLEQIHAMLNAPQEENRETNFVPVCLDGETWYASPALAAQLAEEGISESTWGNLIYNQGWQILVRPDTWETFLQENGMSSEDYALQADKHFFPLDTPWGTFRAADTGCMSYLQGDLSPVSFAFCFDLLPEEAYLSILPALQQQQAEAEQKIHNLFDALSAMDAQEAETYLQGCYQKQLKDAFGDVTITKTRVGLSYRHEDSFWDAWSTRIHLSGTKNDTPLELTITPNTAHGKIYSYSGSYPDDGSSAAKELMQAVFLNVWDYAVAME